MTEVFINRKLGW